MYLSSFQENRIYLRPRWEPWFARVAQRRAACWRNPPHLAFCRDGWRSYCPPPTPISPACWCGLGRFAWSSHLTILNSVVLQHNSVWSARSKAPYGRRDRSPTGGIPTDSRPLAVPAMADGKW